MLEGENRDSDAISQIEFFYTSNIGEECFIMHISNSLILKTKIIVKCVPSSSFFFVTEHAEVKLVSTVTFSISLKSEVESRTQPYILLCQRL